MTCPTTWHSDIVYSDHVVCMRTIEKHFFSPFEYKLHTWRGCRNLVHLEISASAFQHWHWHLHRHRHPDINIVFYTEEIIS